ncbi:MAG: hypothetical protein PHU66_07665 [Bacteroidaceae bacterium]|nr:hypothetical protein [Bacteroidaceae bacterium]
MISPAILYLFIHGNYERYIWIINSPYPFSRFGGGPFQLFIFAGLFIVGIIIITVCNYKGLLQMKKRFMCILLLLIIICSLTGCFSQSINKRISNTIEIRLPTNLKIDYEDTHGGFHGDGETFAKIEFDTSEAENISLQITNHKGWRNLPLSENLNLIMYGGEKNNVEYVYNFAERLGIPYIENGYWFFTDRHRESSFSEKDEDLFQRNSFNFTLALYDTDTNTLYYFEFDT